MNKVRIEIPHYASKMNTDLDGLRQAIAYMNEKLNTSQNQAIIDQFKELINHLNTHLNEKISFTEDCKNSCDLYVCSGSNIPKVRILKLVKK